MSNDQMAGVIILGFMMGMFLCITMCIFVFVVMVYCTIREWMKK